MRELTLEQVEEVSGAGLSSAEAVGILGGMGVAKFGLGWATMGVGAAFAAGPLIVIGMSGLAFYAGYKMFTR
ncbi:hypothetical protein Rhein_2793 [Rheinheimera sp. A13L]|uniref:hypothetical protein n=1 Tax=Rheinheimera sp. A13L TaxID=506534 RepID=UPI0002124C30|nr:hypothetical protein [Rheinheimera sp. A13L]EGM77095.1 hypothetical protein Rhein_2793 [Rheinheimera sp. A13L]